MEIINPKTQNLGEFCNVEGHSDLFKIKQKIRISLLVEIQVVSNGNCGWSEDGVGGVKQLWDVLPTQLRPWGHLEFIFEIREVFKGCDHF